VAPNAEPSSPTEVGEDGKLYFPKGTILEGPRAFRLVQMGVAIPADPECTLAANRTTEQMKTAQIHQEMLSKGIQVQDYQRYLDGEILGYDVEGDDIPGPNWPEDEEDSDDCDPDYEMEDVS